jgi:hypothetical protein
MLDEPPLGSQRQALKRTWKEMPMAQESAATPAAQQTPGGDVSPVAEALLRLHNYLLSARANLYGIFPRHARMPPRKVPLTMQEAETIPVHESLFFMATL